MNAQGIAYRAYVNETRAHNVEPVLLRGDEARAFLQANVADFDRPDSYTTNYFDGGNGARVFNLKDGRVIEYALGGFDQSLVAVFERGIDHANYRKPLGMFHYLNA